MWPVLFAFGRNTVGQFLSIYSRVEDSDFYVTSTIAFLVARISSSDWKNVVGTIESLVGRKSKLNTDAADAGQDHMHDWLAEQEPYNEDTLESLGSEFSTQRQLEFSSATKSGAQGFNSTSMRRNTKGKLGSQTKQRCNSTSSSLSSWSQGPQRKRPSPKNLIVYNPCFKNHSTLNETIWMKRKIKMRIMDLLLWRLFY